MIHSDRTVYPTMRATIGRPATIARPGRPQREPMRERDAGDVPAHDRRDAQVPDEDDRDRVELWRDAHEWVDQQRRQPHDALDHQRQVVGDDVAAGDRQQRRRVPSGKGAERADGSGPRARG